MGRSMIASAIVAREQSKRATLFDERYECDSFANMRFSATNFSLSFPTAKIFTPMVKPLVKRVFADGMKTFITWNP